MPDTTPRDGSLETDVLVIGAGLAGFCASLEALAACREVMLLEKQEEVGGSTVLSGGAMAFAGTEEQAAAGIADSSERLGEDLLKVGEHRNDPGLVAAYVSAQLETYRWLREQGVRFASVQLGGGQSVPRSKRVDTRQMIDALAARASANNRFQLRTGNAVQRLIREGERVTGAVVGALEIRARHGVVLASGGFSRDEALLALFAPAQRDALRIALGGPSRYRLHSRYLRHASRCGVRAAFHHPSHLQGRRRREPARAALHRRIRLLQNHRRCMLAAAWGAGLPGL
ncbi:MAG: FAD-dependent oxidoreductase [Rhodospirillales bacterium]|nr:FAD-dependent oxidoreductase [Rhodospirillales bacterium]